MQESAEFDADVGEPGEENIEGPRAHDEVGHEQEHEVTDIVAEMHLQETSDSETETSFVNVETREVNLTKS